MNKDRIIIACVLFACVIGAVYWLTGNAEAEPISAEGMSIEDRGAIDSKVIAEELAYLDEPLSVHVDYENSRINVETQRISTDQHVDDFGKEIKEAVKLAIKERRSETTLEKEKYSVIVYGKDGSLIAY